MDTSGEDPVTGVPAQPVSGGAAGHDYQPSYWTPSYTTTHADGAPPAGPAHGSAPGESGTQPTTPPAAPRRPAHGAGVRETTTPGDAAADTLAPAAPPEPSAPQAPAGPPRPPEPPLVARVGMDAGPRQVDFPAPRDTQDLSPHMTGMSAMPGWQPRRRPGGARALGPLAALATLAVFGLVAAHMAGVWGGDSGYGSASGDVAPAGIESEAADPVPTQPPDAPDPSVPGVHVADLAYQPRGLTCGRRALTLLPPQHADLPTGRQWCVLDVTVQPGDGAGSTAEGPDASDATLRDAGGHRWAPDGDTTSADDADSVLSSSLQQVATVHYWFVVDKGAHPTAVTFAHEGDTSAAVELG